MQTEPSASAAVPPKSLDGLLQWLAERVRWLRTWHLAESPKPIPGPFLDAIIALFDRKNDPAPTDPEWRRLWAQEHIWRFSELTIEQTHAGLEQLGIFDTPPLDPIDPYTNQRCMIEALDQLTTLRSFIARRAGAHSRNAAPEVALPKMPMVVHLSAIAAQPNRTPSPSSDRGEQIGEQPPNVFLSSGLVPFNVAAVFRCAVELGAIVAEESATSQAGEPISGELSHWVNEPAEKRRIQTEVATARRCETAMKRLMAVLNPRSAPFPAEWKESLDLADASEAARQAMLTLGLALADLRGDPQLLDQGQRLLSAGAWRLWEGMKPAERELARPLLATTHRLWGWPNDPNREPAPFAGPMATFSDDRTLVPEWRTVGESDVKKLQSSLATMQLRPATLATAPADPHTRPQVDASQDGSSSRK